jgi:hypothetical protein
MRRREYEYVFWGGGLLWESSVAVWKRFYQCDKDGRKTYKVVPSPDPNGQVIDGGDQLP